jgi:hypothetical protein
VAELLEQPADMAASQGQAEKAVHLVSAASRLRAENDNRMSALYRQPVGYAGLLENLKASPGEAVARAWDEGQPLTMEQAAEVAASD